MFLVTILAARWIVLLPQQHTEDGRERLIEGRPMTGKLKFREPRSGKAELPNEIEERIRRRAYELYEQRGSVDGFALDDWLQAELEISSTRKRPKARAARGAQC